jgi:hypothetical protein
LAALAGGGAVLVWENPLEPLRVQQLAPDATPFAASVVKPETAPPFSLVAITGLPDGGYVVAWADSGTVVRNVYARRYAADGTAAGEATRINLVTTSAGLWPRVVVMAGGGFMITWEVAEAGGGRSTYGRLFPANGLLGMS